MLTVDYISWDEIFYIWKNHLWLERKSPIKPINPMLPDLSVNMDIYDFAEVYFLGVFSLENKLIAVNSFFNSNKEKTQIRSRGLYVFNEFRNLGIGKLILSETIKNSRIKFVDSQMIWSIPRRSSFHVYEKVGFKQSTDWFYENMEFGPNCVAICEFK